MERGNNASFKNVYSNAEYSPVVAITYGNYLFKL